MWLILALAVGFLNAVYAALAKKLVSNFSPFLTGFFAFLFALPVLLVALSCSGWAELAPFFWEITLAGAVLNVSATALLFYAFKVADLSLTVPFLSFTPLFMLVTSRVMVGETLTSGGIAGILALVAGAYMLQIGKESGILGPFKALAKNKGSMIALLVAFIYAVASNIDKIAIANSNPAVYPVVVYAMITALFLAAVIFRKEYNEAGITKNLFGFLLVGSVLGLTTILYALAVNLGPITYIIALKRTNAFWSVVLGYLVFRERNVRTKMIGALFMIAGVLLISFG